MSNVKLSDISVIHKKADEALIVKILARITKCATYWNQQFNIEGSIKEEHIMNFLYWLNEYLVEEHGLSLEPFQNWDKFSSDKKYLWDSKA